MVLIGFSSTAVEEKPIRMTMDLLTGQIHVNFKIYGPFECKTHRSRTFSGVANIGLVKNGAYPNLPCFFSFRCTIYIGVIWNPNSSPSIKTLPHHGEESQLMQPSIGSKHSTVEFSPPKWDIVINSRWQDIFPYNNNTTIKYSSLVTVICIVRTSRNTKSYPHAICPNRWWSNYPSSFEKRLWVMLFTRADHGTIDLETSTLVQLELFLGV